MASYRPDRFHKQGPGLVANCPNVIGQFFCYTKQNVQKMFRGRVLKATLPSMKLTRLLFHFLTSLEESRLIQLEGRLGAQYIYYLSYTVSTHTMSPLIALSATTRVV